MSNTNPARGMRDFLPEQIRKREYVIGVIKSVYEKYGFEPLETPSIENLSTLTSKAGEESDQLMFKILKRGEKLQKELGSGELASENDLADLALRYDLTVPLARVIANNRNELPKFFKRYQIQPVWRADRPARGRFREFYQCDVDAIGSKSMVVEAELISAVSEILEKLGFDDFVIRMNHRELLRALLSRLEIAAEDNSDAMVALDKLDKIGRDGVLMEFEKRGLGSQKAGTLLDLIEELEMLDESKVFAKLSSYFSDDEVGITALGELKKIFTLAGSPNLKLDPSLARGLSYYTGAIYEINVRDMSGSIASGGRYDGLIGMFGNEEIPAVGFSLGLERILLIMEERDMFPDDLLKSSGDVMLTIWSAETAGESLKLASELRKKGLRVFVYPQADKLGKQFKYANQINVQSVCVLGETEIQENTVTLKNMKTGEQETISVNEAIQKLIDLGIAKS